MMKELTPIEGCYMFRPDIFGDNRGSFLESYNEKAFREALGRDVHFVQDNLSVSVKGTLRGLHFQKGKASQAKLVQVMQGQVQDVVVDLRPGSASYGSAFSVILDDADRCQLFIPKGCAHGFLALTDQVIFSYKCDAFYNPQAEGGIRYDDPELQIRWQLPDEELILSEKDKVLKTFRELESEGIFNW